MFGIDTVIILFLYNDITQRSRRASKEDAVTLTVLYSKMFQGHTLRGVNLDEANNRLFLRFSSRRQIGTLYVLPIDDARALAIGPTLPNTASRDHGTR